MFKVHILFELYVVSYLFIVVVQDIKCISVIVMINTVIGVPSLVIGINNFSSCKTVENISVVNNRWKKIFLVTSYQWAYTTKRL